MVQMTSKKKFKVIVPRLNGYKRVPELPSIPHITFLVTVFANGDHTPTQIVYPQKTLPSEAILENIIDDKDYIVTGKAGGWVDKEIFEKYCTEVVIPAFRQRRARKQTNERGMYIVDGHTSRWNAHLMKRFADEDIDVVTFVSHTSHIVQPLDCIVFSVFKGSLAKHLRTALKRAANDKAAAGFYPAGDFEDDSDQEIDNSIIESMEIDEDRNAELEEQVATTLTQMSDSSVSILTAAEKRYVLIEVAKMSLYVALYREHVRQSFKMTGIFPPSLEMALSRNGIRLTPDLANCRANFALNKKRKRVSINGIHLNGEKGLALLQESEEKARKLPTKRRKLAESDDEKKSSNMIT